MNPTRKAIKPTSPGLRALVCFSRNTLHKGKPYKKLVTPQKSKGGRNNNGHMTVRHRGGGVKRVFRIVDFRRRSAAAQVIRIEHDPNRSGRLALTKSISGEIKYVLATEGMKAGD